MDAISVSDASSHNGAESRRGSHRRRYWWRMVATGVAVLAVAGGTAAWSAHRNGPDRAGGPAGASGPTSIPPSATPSATPGISASARPPVALTPAMFLTAQELGPGPWVIEQSSDYRRDNWPWQEICRPYRRADYPSLARRAQVDWREFHRPAGSMAGLQTIERYEPGSGPRNLDDVRARLRACAGLQSPDPVVGDFPRRWTIVAEGFAGDDAVLARCEVFADGSPGWAYYAFAVRVGDLVSNVWLDRESTTTTARYLAERAAGHLR